MTDDITISIDGRIQRIVFSRPAKKNALTAAMYGAATEAIQAADSESRIGVTVLTGEGDFFTAGNDLGEFLSGLGRAGDAAPPPIAFLLALVNAEKPVLASVNGPAVGIGLTMLLHCDYVLAAENAFLHAPFIDLGLTPEGGSSLLLPKLLGRRLAGEILLLGERIPAPRAAALGLVNRAIPHADLEAQTGEIAARFAAKAPDALRRAKALMLGDRPEIIACIDRERRIFAERLQSAEFKEAATAFLEKRPPDFARS